MEHARSVLHLFPSCVALETVNETRNREQWRHAFYDNYLSKIGFRDLLDSFDSRFRHQLKIDLIPNSETMRTKDYNYNINIHIFLFV